MTEQSGNHDEGRVPTPDSCTRELSSEQRRIATREFMRQVFDDLRREEEENERLAAELESQRCWLERVGFGVGWPGLGG